jgi:hypothetical protein
MDASAGTKIENIHFYTVRPQLTEGAGETPEPQSESFAERIPQHVIIFKYPKQEIYCNWT